MKGKGVSPVIGVMLMLVVAILLAAAVSSYVGQIQMKKPAPSAVFDCRIVKKSPSGMGGWVTYMELRELSGDSIPTKDIEIITYNPDAAGPHKVMVIRPEGMNTHYYINCTEATWYETYGVSYTYNGVKYVQRNTTITVYNATSNTKASVPLYVFEGPYVGNQPYLNNMAYGPFGIKSWFYPTVTIKFFVYNSSGFVIAILDASSYDFKTNTLNLPTGITVTEVAYVKEILEFTNPGNPKVDFGKYTIRPGTTMTADWWYDYVQSKWNAAAGQYSGSNVTGFCACIADGWNVTPGHYVTVRIVYIPTHTVIWEKKVMVESGE